MRTQTKLEQSKTMTTTTDYGTVIGTGEVRFERTLPGPIANVWSYLVEPDKLRQWFAGGTMELKSGGKVELTFRNSELSGHKEPVPDKYQKYEGHQCTGQVTRCEPPRVLTYLWNEAKGGATEVTFELSPSGNNVRLVLTHRRLPTRGHMVGVSSGWHVHLNTLADLLNAAEPRPFWSTLSRLESEYERSLPADAAGERAGM